MVLKNDGPMGFFGTVEGAVSHHHLALKYAAEFPESALGTLIKVRVRAEAYEQASTETDVHSQK